MSDVRDDSEPLFSLYARSDGSFMILQSYVGQNIPAYIDNLMFIGETRDPFIMLNYHLSQGSLAKLCGVGQQAVTRYIDGSSSPTLTLDQWTPLITTLFNKCVNLPAHKHTSEMYKQNVMTWGKKTRTRVGLPPLDRAA